MYGDIGRCFAFMFLSTIQDFDGAGSKINTPAVLFPIPVAGRFQALPATYFDWRT